VLVPASPSLEPTAVTVETWVNAPASPGDFKHLVAKGAFGCLAASYALSTGADGGLVFNVSDGPSFASSPDAGTAVWDGRWHHVAGTFDGASVRLYVDGAEIGSGTSTPFPIGYATQTAELVLGTYGDACPDLDFAGQLDEARIWSRALGPEELAASAAMGAGSANELSVDAQHGDLVVVTAHFRNGAGVTISLESSSGERTIARVVLEKSKKGSASCGGNPCPAVPSNGGRTAAVPTSGDAKSAKLRVTLDSGDTFAVNVALST
jgi:hypothetical protein